MEHRPLQGTSVVVTRASDQASALSARLVALGAHVVEVPTIAIVDAADGGAELRAALASLDEVDWLVVTSPNGVDRVLAVEPDLAGRLTATGPKVAVVGPGTAAALERHGIAADLQPERFVAEGLLEAFPAPPSTGGTVLLAQAAGARPVLAEGLRAAGWTVRTAEAYRTVHPEIAGHLAAQARQADVVTFTSGSTVTGYAAGVGLDPPPRAVVCIGPVTADAARREGLTVDAVADPHTIDGVVDAVVALVVGRAS